MEVIDAWKGEDFEDSVSSILIACYETKLESQKKWIKSERVSLSDMLRARAVGPYIPSRSREVIEPEDIDGEFGYFDTKNDNLPSFAVSGMVFNAGDFELPECGNVYACIATMEALNKTPKGFIRQTGGNLYKLKLIYATSHHLANRVSCVTVSKSGEVATCFISKNEAANNKLNGHPILTELRAHRENTAGIASVILQEHADRRFCWSITAQEAEARANLGCMKEEIKSLLYARSLPMTATGRKRPILHLVESHKRRLRNGTDIDITAFLSGTQVVDIGGTAFTVNPPLAKKTNLSLNSQDNYYGHESL